TAARGLMSYAPTLCGPLVEATARPGGADGFARPAAWVERWPGRPSDAPFPPYRPAAVDDVGRAAILAADPLDSHDLWLWGTTGLVALFAAVVWPSSAGRHAVEAEPRRTK
ncbi:MAG TPA: hypothetical protein VF796_23335, partial [Humisphaera sp.]